MRPGNSFSTGFRAPCRRLEALDRLLKSKGLKLDAAVELRVNESALLQRVEARVAQMRERGEEVRIDDTPEVLSKRLASYRTLTQPLVHYYSEKRKLVTIDGMMTIEHVTRDINRILAAIMVAEPVKKARKPAAAKAAKGGGQGESQIARLTVRRNPRKRLPNRPARPTKRPQKVAKKPIRRSAAKPAVKKGQEGREIGQKGHEKAS